VGIMAEEETQEVKETQEVEETQEPQVETKEPEAKVETKEPEAKTEELEKKEEMVPLKDLLSIKKGAEQIKQKNAELEKILSESPKKEEIESLQKQIEELNKQYKEKIDSITKEADKKIRDVRMQDIYLKYQDDFELNEGEIKSMSSEELVSLDKILSQTKKKKGISSSRFDIGQSSGAASIPTTSREAIKQGLERYLKK
jgi:hypothetical protein